MTTITVSGAASIYRPAERCVLTGIIKSDGPQPGPVAKDCKLEITFVKELVQPHLSKSSEETAAITFFSVRSLTTNSHYTYLKSGEKGDKVYTAQAQFEIKIQDFSLLSNLASQLADREFVNINALSWRLTDKTKKTLEADVRNLAVADAFERAKQLYAGIPQSSLQQIYCLNITEGGANHSSPSSHRDRAAYRSAGPAQDEGFDFEPQSVQFATAVTARFAINCTKDECGKLLLR